MSQLNVPVRQLDHDYLSRVQYALTFVSEDVLSYRINEEKRQVELDLRTGTDSDIVREKVNQLLERYDQGEFGFKSIVHFEHSRPLAIFDAWAGLLERKWVTQVGEGHVILRGPAAQLMALIDSRVEKMFVKIFGAELEIFPSTIRSASLDRCNHFTSFPEHMDFVAHLKQDFDVLETFSGACRKNGWSAQLHEGTMGPQDFAVSPSCCYHCYEGMEGWELAKPGRCVTAILGCHRYEGANHKSLSRLRAFTMRELIWIGHPSFVLEARDRAERLIIQWARDWEISGTFETANDMFFTDEFAVKASFQRQQEAKRELRAVIPSEKQSISIFSSNFHSTTFGKAFGITVGGKPATSGCIGWGYERWVYAIFSQFGFDPEQWPPTLKADFEQHLKNQ